MFLFSTSYVLGGNCVYNNGGCDHVCLNRLNPRGQVCVCEEGFELSEDGKTCTSLYIKTIRCETFGPRTHFKSRLSLIFRAKVVLITDLIGQLRRDVIGRLSVKP